MSDNQANGKVVARSQLVIKTIADYEIEDVEYIEGFEGMLPRGMLSLLVGDSGLGKSTLAAYICAHQAKLGNVTCLCVAEDRVEHIVKPRLLAAGLEPKNQHLVKILGLEVDGEESQLRLPEHADLIRDGLRELAALGQAPTWVNLDPVTHFLNHTIDNARDQDVRQALGPLGFICSEFGSAVTVTAHFNKGSGTTVMERLANSAAFYQLPRSIIMLARDPDDPDGEKGDRRVLASEKLSVDRKPTGHTYVIKGASVVATRTKTGFRDTSYLERSGQSTTTPSQLLAHSRKQQPTRTSPQSDTARSFLLDLLAEGPLPGADVGAAAEAIGLSSSTLLRASHHLGVRVEASGFPRTTTWSLP